MDLEGSDRSLIRDTMPQFGRSARISLVKKEYQLQFQEK
jgi:hypothetical protein